MEHASRTDTYGHTIVFRIQYGIYYRTVRRARRGPRVYPVDRSLLNIRHTALLEPYPARIDSALSGLSRDSLAAHQSAVRLSLSLLALISVAHNLSTVLSEVDIDYGLEVFVIRVAVTRRRGKIAAGADAQR
jgi:hypothetical protein